MRVRPPAVAGTFYPADPARLRAAVARALVAATPDAAPPPKALVAPHAGYVYSGPIAGNAWARVAPLRDVVRRVVVLAPAHRARVRALATTSADAFATPLGLVRVDDELRRRALALPSVVVDDLAHASEHAVEVQLPFLQAVLGDPTLLPLVVGDAGPDEVCAVLDAVWGGPETLVVVSTDLSHYLEYREAAARDRQTAAHVVARDEAAIADDDACGARPLRGLLATARRRDLAVRLLDLRSSGDTAGDPDAVVGYGAFAVG
jgi:AmmeMemoRadiSam system protein B